MVRNIKFDHNVVVTGTNDGTKQVSKDAWNDGHDETGMFGHGTVTTLTVATGAVVPINDMHKLDGEGAAADDLDTITNTETLEFDELDLLSGAQTVTITNSGNIVTLSGADVILSTTVPTHLRRAGTSWFETIPTANAALLDKANIFTGGDISVARAAPIVKSDSTDSSTRPSFALEQSGAVAWYDYLEVTTGHKVIEVSGDVTAGLGDIFSRYIRSGTSASHIEQQANILFLDGILGQFGSSGDLSLNHDGSNSLITNITGNLIYQAATSTSHIFQIPVGTNIFTISESAVTSTELLNVVSATLDKTMSIEVGNSNASSTTASAFLDFKVIGGDNQVRLIRNAAANGTFKMGQTGTGNFIIDTNSSSSSHIFSITDVTKLTLANALATFTTDTTVAGLFKVTGVTSTVSNAFPQFRLDDTDGPADAKKWSIEARASQLVFRTLNDAEGVEDQFLTVGRSGNVVTNMTFTGDFFNCVGDLVTNGKFRIDGNAGGDTHIEESAANIMSFTVAGAEKLRINSDGNIGIAATNAIKLDGVTTAGDTFLAESSSNVMSFTTGGGVSLALSVNDVALGARFLKYETSAELTIATGAITPTQTLHSVDTEADAATDDLVTINAASEGRVLVLRANIGSRTVVVKDGGSSIRSAGDFSLDENTDMMTFMSSQGIWAETSRSDNAA